MELNRKHIKKVRIDNGAYICDSFDSKFMVMGLISAGEGEGVTSVFIYVHEYTKSKKK